jgi:hypothetical protein
MTLRHCTLPGVSPGAGDEDSDWLGRPSRRRCDTCNRIEQFDRPMRPDVGLVQAVQHVLRTLQKIPALKATSCIADGAGAHDRFPMRKTVRLSNDVIGPRQYISPVKGRWRAFSRDGQARIRIALFRSPRRGWMPCNPLHSIIVIGLQPGVAPDQRLTDRASNVNPRGSMNNLCASPWSPGNKELVIDVTQGMA